jgi:hypothetical protein
VASFDLLCPVDSDVLTPYTYGSYQTHVIDVVDRSVMLVRKRAVDIVKGEIRARITASVKCICDYVPLYSGTANMSGVAKTKTM